MEEINSNQNENQEAYQLTIVQKRQKTLGILFLLFFAAITFRLFWIQIVRHDDYLTRAKDQLELNLETGIARGQIYDRNMIPFTDRELKKVIVINGNTNKEEAAELLAKAAGISTQEMLNKIRDAEGRLEIEAKDFDNAELQILEKGMVRGISIIEKRIRYSEDSLASHVIGHLSDSDLRGQIGIEKSMDNLLAQGGGERIVAIVDSQNNLIPSLGFQKIEVDGKGDRLGIKLTLDFHMQKIVEDVLKEKQITGSAVVMDVKNGDILAMASTPDFDQGNIKKYITRNDDLLINKAITNFDLGSIFKTVVAAAALENGLVDLEETFLCEGEIPVNNSVIKCATYNSHKETPITLKDAFAISCNTTFVKLGMRVGAAKILAMAKTMGFSEKQCSELLEEKAGYIPTTQEDGIGNISIGQGKIQATPLQVTTMMATIANNGIMNKPNIIISVLNDKTGETIENLTRSTPTTVLRTSTTDILKDYLHQVTTTGTGKQANLDEFGGSSGKTSSAETGMSGEIVHGWFAGFVPSDKPQYAITVFVYNGKSGGSSAAPLFKEIARKIFTEYKPIN